MTNGLFEVITLVFLAYLFTYFLITPIFLSSLRPSWRLFLLQGCLFGMITYVFVGVWVKWFPPLILMVVLSIIRMLSTLILKKSERNETLLSFSTEQILILLLSILAAFLLYSPIEGQSYWSIKFPSEVKIIVVGLYGVILLGPFGGRLIGHCIKPLQDQLVKRFQSGSLKPIRGLTNGGMVIGYLERLLIAIFILTGEFSGVGFLIAAKSIFRFGELKDGENRKQAEYIIIGTFASFLLAIIISLGLRVLLGLDPAY